ncbi:VOC family protein [Guptibacillus algicola]|uniref:VOC family protein n=1 Tax=Guptibacillus algicola TaxID=225844 RepID=UPI001CD3428D|nr:VOC family protein [Alkalihalobacillus algicola]MCA0987558.1 VOC family protein [Alkalihalobacillus algicola]
MASLIKRVGTTYIPVANPAKASEWYQETLGAVETYRDQDKAILDFADQSFFLVKAMEGARVGFTDYKGNVLFCLTFEVDGLAMLQDLHALLLERDVDVGEIEDRGHVGNNFVFSDPDGNLFDVWSELSPKFQ